MAATTTVPIVSAPANGSSLATDLTPISSESSILTISLANDLIAATTNAIPKNDF